MKITRPVWDTEFRCLTTACPDTCCAGWEIPVDEKSAARLRAMEGGLGQRLREALVEQDGEIRFAMRGGRCAMLNERNLCDLYAACGEEALCRTCRLHPRFVAQYGARREVMPGLSCPEWIEVFLKRPEKVEFVTEDTDEEITEYTDIDALLFFRLMKARTAALELVQDRERSIRERLEGLLTLAEETDGAEERGACPAGPVLPVYLGKLASLEILTPQWKEQLDRSLAHRGPAGLSGVQRRVWEAAAEKLLVYDLFRFFLEGVYTGRVLPLVKMAVFHVLVLGVLASESRTADEIYETARLYSKEIEHSAENQTALRRSFCRRSGRYSGAGIRWGMEELL